MKQSALFDTRLTHVRVTLGTLCLAGAQSTLAKIRFFLRMAMSGMLVAALFLAALYAALFLHNNFGSDRIEVREVGAARRRATDWLLAHRGEILEDRNVMLWWMVRQAAEVSQDIDLILLVNEHRQRFVKREPESPWRRLVDDRYAHLDAIKLLLADLPVYNLHFLYGLSCDRTLGEMDLLRQQLSIDYCPEQHSFSPACQTHQLMGFRFMQRFGCGDPDEVDWQIDHLRERITWQSWLDPRVVDVYLQRVLMLVEGGDRNAVRERWIRRILDHQLPDGGWGDRQALVLLDANRAFGFSARGLTLVAPRSSFHATAQGLWLMALLDHQKAAP